MLVTLALICSWACDALFASLSGLIQSKGTSNNDDFFVRSIAGAAGR